MGVKKFIKKSVAFVAAAAMALTMVAMPVGSSSSYAAEGTDDNLHLSKGIELQSDGNYKITLEAYSTGKDTTTTTDKAVPLDIILVLDQSGSMKDDFSEVSYSKKLTAGNSKYSDAYDKRSNLYVLIDGKYYKVTVNRYRGRYTISYKKDGQRIVIVNNQSDSTLNVDMYSQKTTKTTRLAALKSAVTNFVETVEEKAQGDPNVTGDEVDHRIAIVGFASENGYGNNTEILSVEGNNSGSVGVKYNDSAGYTSATTKAFQDTTTDPGKAMLTNAIGALDANGATNTGLGMKMANDILTNDVKKDETGRKKLVIMFTDGTPTTQNQFSNSVANTAISNSKTIKASGTRVYSIGIFDGADPTSLSSNENKFMNYVSSNYPQVSNMSDKNPTGSNEGYYKAASNTSELNSIFESIQESETTSESTVTLKDDSVLRDVISDKFELPDGAEASAVSVSTADSKTVSEDGKDITWDTAVKDTSNKYPVSINGKKVDVTGFDYSKYFVTANHGGKKLIVEIIVNGLQSGIDMDSNDTETEKSGIYENSSATTAVKNFVSPKVTIPEYSYVLDYGKKVTIPNKDTDLNKDYSETTQFNSTKAAPSKDKSIKKTYGTFALENKTVTYQPGRINWDGFDSIFSFSKKTGDEYEWSKTNVIPANSVYYEDDFASTATVEEGDTGTKIIYNEKKWTVDGTAQNSEKQSSNNEVQHGWDDSYKYDRNYSNGTAHKGTTGATATFKFTGTGVDIYSRTDLTTGKVIATLTKNGEVEASKLMIVDNKSASGTYYQVPTLFFEDLDYGTYEVKIQVLNPIKEGETTRGTYYLDGIRVYNPLGVTTSEKVTNAYNVAGESNAIFTSVRKMLLDAKTFDGDTATKGAVFIDQLDASNNNSSGEAKTATIGTYEKLGPKNEVYLDAGQAIAFKINTPYTGKVFIGAKSLNGQQVSMKVTDITTTEKTKTVTLSHTSDMYYQINPTTEKYVVIQNTNNTKGAILAITKLRLTGVPTATTQSSIDFESSPAVMSYVNEFATLDSAKTDDRGMAIENDKPNVDIENPDNSKDDNNQETKPDQSNSNSIWNSIMNTLRKWFK